MQVASHRAVALTHLAKHVSLVRLLFVGDPERVLLVGSVLPVNIRIIRRLVMLLKPLSLVLHRLLEQDVLFTVLVDVLEQVDASLVLTAPLLLSSIPLLLILHLSQLIYHLLVCCLVRPSILVVSLELLNLLTTSHALF